MFSRALGIAIASMCFMLHAAEAKQISSGNAVGAAESAFAPVYGSALPPVGFVQFCKTNKSDCKPLGSGSPRIELSDESWLNIVRINSYVNRSIKPESDQDLYHVPEYWTYPVSAGDCEDYVLLKKRYLEGLGLSAEALLITVVLDEHGEGHAVLTVETDRGDYILDNRRDQVLLWSETEYRFLKRQTSRDPKKWVAMAKEGQTSVVGLTKERSNNE